jgi:hypothetical protein
MVDHRSSRLPAPDAAQPSPEEVRARLARIVASPASDVPERSRGFRKRIAELVRRVQVGRPMRTRSPISVVRSA